MCNGISGNKTLLKTKQRIGMMNDRLALGRVVRAASLKRQYLGQEINKGMSESSKGFEGGSCR